MMTVHGEMTAIRHCHQQNWARQVRLPQAIDLPALCLSFCREDRRDLWEPPTDAEMLAYNGVRTSGM
jgi:hypothetical protein